MAYKKNVEVESYDVFPRVVAAGKETCIHIRPLGVRREFEPGEEYDLTIAAMTTGRPKHFPQSADFQKKKVRCDQDGCFAFQHIFEKEQEYYLRLFYVNPKTGKRGMRQVSVYCVADDLIGRYPFVGDLHIHTCCSDGGEQPETVCAAYRKQGYDFMTISDHNRYYPSLRAMEFYKEVPTELTIVQGEEVHMTAPGGDDICDIHIVNFGGEYSVNALVEGPATREKGKEVRFRATRPDCPPVMSEEEYYELMQERASKLDLPEGVDPLCTAVVSWVFEQIHNGNGLGVLAHPFWINDVQNVPDAQLDYIIGNHLMDAVEVLGGDHYYEKTYCEQNRLQMARYGDDRARGWKYGVVGTSDSHSCLSTNPDAYITSTMVFAPANERMALIDSIKGFYSVAIDHMHDNYHIFGELRLARYCNFLLKYYVPLHDDLCFEEGRLMQQYATGTEQERQAALAGLHFIYGRVAKMREKYFDF